MISFTQSRLQFACEDFDSGRGLNSAVLLKEFRAIAPPGDKSDKLIHW